MDFFHVAPPEKARIHSTWQLHLMSRYNKLVSCDKGRCQRVTTYLKECRVAHRQLP